MGSSDSKPEDKTPEISPDVSKVKTIWRDINDSIGAGLTTLKYSHTEVEDFLKNIHLLGMTSEQLAPATNFLAKFEPELTAKYLGFEGYGGYFKSGFHGLLAADVSSCKLIGKGFETLKDIAADQKSSVADRIYALRTMGKMSIINGSKRTAESLIEFLKDKDVSFQTRYQVFATGEAGIAFNNWIVQDVHLFYYDHAPMQERIVEKLFDEDIIYKILSAQYILTYISTSREKRESIESWLAELLQLTLNKELQAEIADILIRLSPKYQKLGEKYIELLGNEGKTAHYSTVYLNAQNVHDDGISESVKTIIRRLQYTGLPKGDFMEMRVDLLSTFERLEGKFSSQGERIVRAFERITIDTGKYEGSSLANICLMVWGKIKDSEYQQELKVRMLEELAEMDRTCSSGHVARICNILSGYVPGFEVSISFSSQLKSNIIARYNCAIRKLEKTLPEQRDELREKILIELISTGDRPELFKFLEDYSPRAELQKEFSGLLPPEEFDKIFGSAVKEYSNQT